MDFLTFLGDYENENVSDVKALVDSTKQKESAIIEEAFKGEFPSKKEAIFNLAYSFQSKDTAPEGVDVEFVKENFDALVDKIENLSEGDIRIIIHNHESKDKDAESSHFISLRRHKGYSLFSTFSTISVHRVTIPAMAPIATNTGAQNASAPTPTAPMVNGASMRVFPSCFIMILRAFPALMIFLTSFSNSCPSM